MLTKKPVVFEGNEAVHAHIMAGVKTHMIFDARVTFEPAQDPVQFPFLLNQAASSGTFCTCYTDTAYCTERNFISSCEDLGATAYLDVS